MKEGREGVRKRGKERGTDGRKERREEGENMFIPKREVRMRRNGDSKSPSLETPKRIVTT